jgi:ATP phosphoribosyltransferase
VLDDGVILRSEANLVASLGAAWGERARSAARTLLTRIAAEEEARTTREIRAAIDPTRPVELSRLAGLATLPYGAPRGPELVLRCAKDRVFAVVDALVAAGAAEVTVGAVDYVFRPGNPLADRLFARLR